MRFARQVKKSQVSVTIGLTEVASDLSDVMSAGQFRGDRCAGEFNGSSGALANGRGNEPPDDLDGVYCSPNVKTFAA
jgi:hypothetical protein